MLAHCATRPNLLYVELSIMKVVFKGTKSNVPRLLSTYCMLNVLLLGQGFELQGCYIYIFFGC